MEFKWATNRQKLKTRLRLLIWTKTQFTFIYVDNADMAESRLFLKTVSQNPKYQLQYKFHGKVVLISNG